MPRNVGRVWRTYEVQAGDLKGVKLDGGVTIQDAAVNRANTTTSPGYALVGLMARSGRFVGRSKITAQLTIENVFEKR